jgi:RNA polymerase sigma factor (sigma-70 family)
MAMPGVDAQTLAELVDWHGAALSLYARQWCQSPDDVVQQAFIELAACPQAPDSPVAWLFAAVRRRAISRARSDRSRRGHEEAAARQWFQRTKDRQSAATLAAELLGELPLAEREIVIAYVYGRLTFDEIARLVGTSTSTARRQYEAALDRLRERIDTPCPKNET